uniref:Zinc finger PHD-type domain-containing protein n=1 Tax=Amphimedon queenslandica TaxID=400682 RepID=A0A1X7U142_AMPQE
MTARNSNPKSNTKAKGNPVCICSICEDPIAEQDEKRGIAGEEAIECENPSCGWMHRLCAGISKSAFRSLSSSLDPFFCPYCRLDFQAKEITSLKEKISDLSSTVSNLSSLVSDLSQKLSSVFPTTRAPAHSSDQPPARSSSDHPSARPTVHDRTPFSDSQRKFNLVLHGIPENPHGTSLRVRQRQDHDKVASVLGDSVPSLSSVSVRDCLRLGKYDRHSTKPRSLLVKFNSSKDVQSILSERTNIHTSDGSPVYVKRDLPLKERKIESYLLKERRSLLDKGTARSSIKIRGSGLYIDTLLHGRADITGFTCQSAAHSDVTPTHPSTPVSLETNTQFENSPSSDPCPSIQD